MTPEHCSRRARRRVWVSSRTQCSRSRSRSIGHDFPTAVITALDHRVARTEGLWSDTAYTKFDTVDIHPAENRVGIIRAARKEETPFLNMPLQAGTNQTSE